MTHTTMMQSLWQSIADVKLAIGSKTLRRTPNIENVHVVVKRIQLSRAKGWRIPENTRKVDRATLHGNPFPVERYGREAAVQMYRDWLTGVMTREVIVASFPPMLATHLIAKHGWVLESLPHLRGKNLACWCQLPENGQPDSCHAALLMELANA